MFSWVVCAWSWKRSEMLISWCVLQCKSRSLLRSRFLSSKFKPAEQDGTTTFWLNLEIHPHIFPQQDIDGQLGIGPSHGIRSWFKPKLPQIVSKPAFKFRTITCDPPHSTPPPQKWGNVRQVKSTATFEQTFIGWTYSKSRTLLGTGFPNWLFPRCHMYHSHFSPVSDCYILVLEKGVCVQGFTPRNPEKLAKIFLASNLDVPGEVPVLQEHKSWAVWMRPSFTSSFSNGSFCCTHITPFLLWYSQWKSWHPGCLQLCL